VFTLAMEEVDRVIEVPIERLLHPDAVALEERVRSLPPGGTMQVPYYDLDGTRVWGATAMILSEFIALLEHGEVRMLVRPT
jgi:hypothetical protein